MGTDPLSPSNARTVPDRIADGKSRESCLERAGIGDGWPVRVTVTSCDNAMHCNAALRACNHSCGHQRSTLPYHGGWKRNESREERAERGIAEDYRNLREGISDSVTIVFAAKMPTPPTTREIAATLPANRVIDWAISRSVASRVA